MLDWSTIASLATAGGTLVPAIANDPPEKVGFVDGKWLIAEGGRGAVEVADSVIYLAIPVHNAPNGIAVLHGW